MHSLQQLAALLQSLQGSSREPSGVLVMILLYGQSGS